MNGIRYWQLPGSSGLIFRKALYLGPDHVLSVSSNVASQEYRRLYFDEIQALVVTQVETSTRFYGLIFAAIAGALAIALGFKTFARPFPVDTQFVWTVLCALACIGLVVHALTRPTARCSIKTRAGTQFLPSLKRMEVAHRVAAILRAEIEKTQGRLSGDVAENSFIEAAPIPPDAHPSKPWLYYAAFGAMLIFALFWLVHPEFRIGVYNEVLQGLHMSLLALTLAAIVNYGDGIHPLARMAVVLPLGWTMVTLFAAGFVMAGSIPLGRGVRDISEMYWRAEIPDVANANAIAYAVFGVVGTIAMFAGKRRAGAV
jgi:hypothetical protein